MRGSDVFALAFGYVVLAIVSGMFAAMVNEDWDDPGRPAKLFTVGALWPLAIVAAVLFMLAVGVAALGRSYAALWRSWRGPRMPRAEVVTDRRSR